MNKYNFDNIVDRRNTSSHKWNVKENELPMWVADMDYAVLPEVVTAIKDRADISAYGYTEVPEEFFSCYCAWWKKRHHVIFSPYKMIFSTGVVAALDSIFKHLLPSHSGVVLLTPIYHTFFHCVENNNHQAISCPLINNGEQYFIDFVSLENLLKQDNVKAFLLCNPHNPIGRIWEKEELRKIAELCSKYDVLLISDEIHCDIVEPGYQYVPISSVCDNAITLISPTKAFNLAGLQTSCIVCPNIEIHYALQKAVYMDDVGEPNYFACSANIAAYTYGEQWLDEMNEYVYQNKKYFIDFINKEIPQLSVCDNKATYMLWVNISSISQNSRQFCDELRKETGLFVSPGAQFGLGGEGHFRINIATSLTNVKDACLRLKTFVQNYGKNH